MSERAITDRVRELGERIGVKGLSAHDCRHNRVKNAIKGDTDIKALQQAGGWSSPAMPLRYAGSAKVANAGVGLFLLYGACTNLCKCLCTKFWYIYG